MKLRRKLGLGLLLLLSLASTMTALSYFGASPSASAAPGYQYINRVFYEEVAYDPALGGDDIQRVFGNSEYTQTFNDEGAFRANAIGYNCTGSTPDCEAYFILDTGDSTNEVVRFTNYCSVYDPQERPTECRFYPDAAANIDNISIQTADYTSGSRYSYGGGLVDTVTVGDPYNAMAAVSGTYGGGTGGNGNTNTPAAPESTDCEDQGFLAFIACPIIESIDDGIGWIEKNVSNILYLEPDEYQGNNNAVREAWVIFRNISSILLVIVMLVMVISTAVGFGLFDAYTVKKMLPRLVIGAILIQLSWGIMTFAITLTNTVGSGLFGLMLAPFGGSAATDLPSLITAQGAEGGAAGFFMMVLAATAASGVLLGIFGLLSLAATVFLIVLVGFFILVVRQLVIVLALILAPVALVAWIMPGADKGYKLWWDSFSKALMMYPIIMMLFAAGRILAWISIKSNTNDSLDIGFIGTGTPLQLLLVIIAYAAPYFMIPLTLRFAGGLVATLGGFANDKGRGVFDRLKKGRHARMADRFERAGNNELWNERKGGWRGAIAKRANTLASIGTSNPWNTARLYAGTAGGKEIGAKITQRKLDHTRKMAEAISKAGITIDRGLETLAGTKTVVTEDGKVHQLGTIRTQKDLDRATDLLNRSVVGKKGTEVYDSAGNVVSYGQLERDSSGNIKQDVQDRSAALQLQNASNFVLGAHTNPDYGGGSLEGAAVMNWSAQGFADEDKIVTVGNNIGGTLGNLIAQEAAYLGYSKGGRQDLKPTYAAVAGADGQSLQTATPERKKELVKTLKQFEWTSAKASAVKNTAEAFFDVVTEARAAPAGSDDYLVGQAAEKTIAANAMSATDLKSRAEWNKLAQRIFSSEVANLTGQGFSQDEAMERILYDKAYGRGGYNPSNPNQPNNPNNPNNPGNPNQPSDRRLKRNIKHLETLANGIKLYSFKYKFSDTTYVGVMAQDLLDTYPEAVHVDNRGFYMVDYDKLGIKMVTLEEWDKTHTKVYHGDI